MSGEASAHLAQAALGRFLPAFTAVEGRRQWWILLTKAGRFDGSCNRCYASSAQYAWNPGS